MSTIVPTLYVVSFDARPETCPECGTVVYWELVKCLDAVRRRIPLDCTVGAARPPFRTDISGRAGWDGRGADHTLICPSTQHSSTSRDAA